MVLIIHWLCDLDLEPISFDFEFCRSLSASSSLIDSSDLTFLDQLCSMIHVVYEIRLRWNEAATPSSYPEIKQLAIKDEYGFVDSKNLLKGFPAQSVGSSNTDVFESHQACKILITGTSSKQTTRFNSLIHIETLSHLPRACLECGIPTQEIHLHCEYLSITRMFWQDLKDNA
ncbi:hypothetical protein Tco_0199850 [Tanacetum coccineum]